MVKSTLALGFKTLGLQSIKCVSFCLIRPYDIFTAMAYVSISGDDDDKIQVLYQNGTSKICDSNNTLNYNRFLTGSLFEDKLVVCGSPSIGKLSQIHPFSLIRKLGGTLTGHNIP